jgi:hypothetical protein
MYVNKIDEILDNIIDDFYNRVILKEKRIKTIYSSVNYGEKKKDIIEILNNYIKIINIDELRQILGNQDNINIILKIINKYIGYYLLLFIGFFYKENNDKYLNNLIELSKNKTLFMPHFDEIFDSSNIANINKLCKMIKNILLIINMDESKISSLSNNNEYNDTLIFLNDVGKDFVYEAFDIKKLNGEKNEQAHNIIKTIIILLLYTKEDKKNIFHLLEKIEEEKGEFIFIDVVISKRQYIDFSSIEEIMTNSEINSGIAHEVWDYLTTNNKINNFESIDDKILKILNKRILIPIVDDFLLYHKDNEIYEKIQDNKKKKEDTRIKYLINKIETFTDYYNKELNDIQKQNIKKNIYTPFMDRRVILHNGIEDIKIVNKLGTLLKKGAENQDNYNELMNYQIYPYINFKEFKNYGFSIILNNHIDVVRSISFEKTGEFKQNPRNYIQTRIGDNGFQLNIVGFMIPTNLCPIECIYIRETIDIRNLDKKNKNGYNLILDYLRQTKMETIKHNSSVFWLFNLELDIIKTNTYEQISKLTNQEQVRHIISNLYDDLIKLTYNLILDKINKLKEIQIDNAYKILYNLQKKMFEIPIESDIYNNLINKLYLENIVRIIPEYDKQDDIFYGLSGDIIKLEKIKDNKPLKFYILKINLSTNKKKSNDEIILENINAICQHNISWNELSEKRKDNPLKYSDMLYEFVQQYVIENTEQEFVCKSCGELLNIKKFVNDIAHDEDGNLVVLSSLMTVPLEDIPEYEKYKQSIRNIDKIIEKIASIINLPYFVGPSNNVKWKRKAVTKNVIDMLLSNNKYLQENTKQRNEMASRLYGISRELSSLFAFPLDNSIFVYSSKEKDQYRIIKYNNIIIYIMIMIVLEINESHIGFLYGDKKGLCNYNIFEKYGQILFEGLKIRKNISGDVIPIKSYKLLCYIIYLISCMATKYNLWYYDGNVDKKKFNPVIQKIIIHSFIDILNSILENAVKKNAPHIYESSSVQFFNKLQKLYNNENIINKLKESDIDKFSISSNKKQFIITKISPINLLGKYEHMKLDTCVYDEKRLAKYFPKGDPYKDTYVNVSTQTNCQSGQFHLWKQKGKTFICSKCSIDLMKTNLDEKESKKILNKLKYDELQNIASKYCFDGSLHLFIYDEKNKYEKCDKCGFSNNKQFTEKELDQLEENIKKMNDKMNIYEFKNIMKDNEHNSNINHYHNNVINKLKNNLQKNSTRDNLFKFIDNFIDNIQIIIGKDINFNNMFLYDNTYIIDHDYTGANLNKPIILTDNNKIIIKTNHPFFKTDVIFYSDTRINKIDIFYDAYTNILLGYKETNKEFVLYKRFDKKIKIIYSLKNKLKYIGYDSQYINIKNKIIIDDTLNEIEQKKNNEAQILKIIKNIIRDRINNLKKMINEFQRFIYRIKYNYNDINKQKQVELRKENTFFDNEITELTSDIVYETIEKYKKKLNNIQIYDENKKHKIFKHWKAVNMSIFVDSLNDKSFNFNIGLLSVDEINKYDMQGNILLFYIISEFQKLLDYNTNKFTKIYIIHFLIDFINILFDINNKEFITNTYEIKRFNYKLNSSDFINDLDELSYELNNTISLYNETKEDEETSEDIEQKIDNEEEADAIDTGEIEDMEAEYDNAYYRNIENYTN